MDASVSQIYQQEKTEDYNKFMQDMTRLTHSIMLKLRGVKEVYDNNGEVKQVFVCAPKLNTEGLNYVEAKLESTLNANLYMSELTDVQVCENYEVEVVSFSLSLLENKERYGATAEAIKEVIALYSPVVFYALNKAKSDKRFIGETTKQGYMNRSADGQSQRVI